MAVLAGAAAVSGQQLVLFPTCGEPGDTVRICGSGWAEPEPPCDYHFFFNGSVVAPPQPDGLFGPPNTTFTVPSVAPGRYPVRVDLIITENGALVQSKTEPFKVVSGTAQPITGQSQDGGAKIQLTYDPSVVCIADCKEIYFVQTRNTRRILDDDTNQHLPYNQEPHYWPNGDQIEQWFVNDVAIDRVFGKAAPYYGAALVGSKEGDAATSAQMWDQPTRSDSSYGANVKTIKIIFDVNVFCGAGDGAGTWLGNFTWQWSRDKGRKNADGSEDARGTVTLGAASDSQPSGAFTAALNRWIEKNPGFKLPTPVVQDCQ